MPHHHTAHTDGFRELLAKEEKEKEWMVREEGEIETQRSD